jgi:hypothetical protein
MPERDIPAADEPVEQDSCRLVTVVVDGEQIHTRVRGAGEMSDEGRAAFAEIVTAAKRRLEAKLAARNPADYPLDVVFDGDLIHKAKRMGVVGTRVSTLCGLNFRHVPGHDGGLRCPECVTAERRAATQSSTPNGA